MDRLELALRRYQQLVPKPVDHARVPVAKVKIWLKEEVAAALEEFTGRPTFRTYAAWPVSALAKHTGTPERQLVEEVEQALIVCARALSRLTEKKDLLRRLKEAFPPVEHVAEQSVRIDESGIPPLTHQRELFDELSLQLSQIKALAEADQGDLVNVNDYFNPQQEWVRTTDNEYVQRSDFIRSLNRELLPIGNFIVRCLWKRVCQRQAVLQAVRSRCEIVLRELSGRYRKERDALDAGWSAAEELVASLERLLSVGQEAQRRDACVVATQIFTAWHARPDVSWLGLDSDLVQQGRYTIRAQLTQLDNAYMLDRIAASLQSLKFLIADSNSQATEFENAVASGGLVLLESDQVAYWETSQLPHLTGKIWQLLHALASRARLHAAVGPADVQDKDAGPSTSAWLMRRNRLSDKLPPSLDRLVEPGTLPSSYRLKLDPSRIHIFPERK